ncbi:MAG TPA: RNA degradosome polyphosphate kinase [Actinomycetota bacterium]|nr:RNA degradosome polyphosphate kinase [Actinomycetota bacterium]
MRDNPSPTSKEPGTDASPTVDLADDARYLNRELSWLEFNARVLALAEDASLPLLERVKFVAIFASNMDEFFQVRVSGLQEQVEAGVVKRSPDGRTPAEQLEGIRERAQELSDRAATVFATELMPALEKERIRIVRSFDALDPADRAFLEQEFDERIFPVLTPLSVDPAHPFPYISNLSLNLAAMVRDPMTGVRRFARVKVPPLLPRFVPLPDGERFVPLETVIAAHLDRLFPGMELVAHYTFRLTRDADLEVEEDEAEDLLEAIQSVLRRRRRGANPVRLEVDETMSHEVLELLRRELDLEEQEVVVTPGLLDLSATWSLVELDRPELKHEPWVPVTQPRLANGDGPPDLFRVLREGDVLVHHPYDSFSSSVEAFVEQAAHDPAVLAIKQTMYRTSTQESPIIRALIRAAELGKQVVALVELKARFDEEANITYARELEQAGVHVVHGVVGLKTHAKISLVVRREAGGVRRYAHVGTGNYNPVTALLYEDMGLLTADAEIGADLTDLFNLLTGYSRQREYRRLLVAPQYLRPEMVELIRGQAREGGRIVLKMNALVDPDMVDALYEASQAGAEIDLIVRGICCLRPGIPGLSERITVRSLVGRYLEHSRIFRFGARREATHYIGSADLMQRNLDRRVEAVVPVSDPSLAARLDEILDVLMQDDMLSWTLGSDGTWTKVGGERRIDAQQRLQELAVERAGSRKA